MEELDKRFSDEERKAFVKQIADKLYQGIKQIADTPSNKKRRWIWELIQNAKDRKHSFGGVSIQIEIDSTHLRFRHNGEPFNLKSLTGLVHQVSSKYGEDKTDEITGAFGTGFITTHMISKIIEVDGLFDLENGSYKKFSLTLDREANSIDDLILKVERLLEKKDELKDSRLYPPIAAGEVSMTENDFHTTFSYPHEYSLGYVYDGVEDLLKCASYALLFNKQIKRIEIIDKLKNESVNILRGEEKPKAGYSLFSTIINGQEQWLLYTIAEEQTIILAVPVELNNDSLTIKSLEPSTPILFKEFPLIGTESFGYSFVINCKDFYPTEQRDGLRLHEDVGKSDPEVIKNRATLIQARIQAEQVIKSFAESTLAYKNLHLLIKSETDTTTQQEDVRDWLKDNLQTPFRKNVLSLPIVLTSAGYQPLSDCVFPIYELDSQLAKSFYDLACKLLPDKVPVESDFMSWYEIIKSDSTNWGKKLDFGLTDLLAHVQNLSGYDALTSSQQGSDWKKWLNQLYEFIGDANQTHLYADYSIVPNQEKRFIKAEEARKDESIPEVVKNLADEFKKYYRKVLILEGIKCPQVTLGLTVKEISNQLNPELSQLKPEALTENQISALATINTWSQNDKEKSRIRIIRALSDMFPVLAKETQMDENLADFNFDPSLKQLVRYALYCVEQSKNLGVFNAKHLSKSSNDDATLWLDKLLREVSAYKEVKELLNNAAVFPNQRDVFRLRKDVKADKDLLQDKFVKVTYEKVFPEDQITERLLRDGINQELVDEGIELKTIANDLDSRLDSKASEINSEKYKPIFLDTIQWLEKQPDEVKDYFKNLKNRKAELVLRTLDNANDRENVFRIMKSRKNLDKVATLAEKVENIEALTNIGMLAQNANLDLAVVHALVLEKIGKNEDAAWRKAVGDSAENAFKEAIGEIETIYDLDNPDVGLDFIIKSPMTKKECYLEIKSTVIGNENVSMSDKQGPKAVEEKERYALCAISRPSGMTINKDYFIEHAKFTDNIGFLIADKVNAMQSGLSSIPPATNEDINVTLETRKYSVFVNQKIWGQGKTFVEFVDLIKKYLDEPQPAPSSSPGKIID